MPAHYRPHRVLTVVLLVAGLLAACTSGSGGEAVRPTADVVPPPPLGVPGQPNSADQILMWVNCSNFVTLDDAALDLWKSRGIDGFVCESQSLFALAGTNHFTPDVDHIPDGSEFDLERRFIDSKVVQRATAKGMVVYLGFFALNPDNTATPFVDWFDDAGWTSTVLPAATEFASAARTLGFQGLALDQELYPQTGGVATATWVWRYPGNNRSQDDTRAQVQKRGAELMSALATGFPALELLGYGAEFPGTWAAQVQLSVNDNDRAFVPSVQLDFWDGMSGAPGYRFIRYLNEAFYKTPSISGSSWDGALQQEYNLFFSLLSREFSNWAYAAPRFEESPFSWIDAGKTDFERARSPKEVADQLDAFSRWGMGGGFANFAVKKLEAFDYSPYVAGLQAASTPRIVTDQPPTLAITAPSVQPSFSVTTSNAPFTGTAKDPYAIWYVSWSSDRGGNGAAQLTWQPGDGDYRNGFPNWQMQWTASVPLQPGVNVITFTAVGIKGLATNSVVTVNH